MNKWLTVAGGALAGIGLLNWGVVGLGMLMDKDWNLVTYAISNMTAVAIVYLGVAVLGVAALGTAIKKTVAR